MPAKYRKVLIAQKSSGEPLCIDVEACGGFEAACMVVFTQRDAEGRYPTTGPVPPTMPPPLVTGDLDDWLQEQWARVEAEYELRHENYKRAVREWAVFLRARKGDANAASWIIRARKDAEDEGYQLLKLRGLDGNPLPLQEDLKEAV